MLLLALIWSAIVVTTSVDRNERRLDTERTMANVAQAFEERTLRTLDAFDRAIHLLRLEYLRAPTQFPVRAIELQRDIFPDQLLQVSIVGADGYMIFSNLAGNSSQVYVGDREHFKVHVHSSTDQLYISQAVLGRISGRWSLQLTRKITAPDGSFGGIIVLSIPPSAFGNFYDSLNLGDGGALTLVGLDGHIRSRISRSTEDTAAYSKQMPPTRPFMDMAKPAAGLYTESSPVDGVMRIIAYRRIPEYPLVVLAHVPEATALAPADRRRVMLFQAGFVLTLLVLIAAYGIGRLLDERQRNMVLISISEERFRSLVEGTTDWVWETDAEHRFTWFSDTFETIVGIPSSRLLGKLQREMVSNAHEIDAQRWADHRNDLEGHRVFRDFRYWIQTGRDSAKWISISGSPRFGADGTFLGYRGIGSDITSKAEISLRLRMMSKVVEQSPVSVVITDAAGAIQYANRHFTEVTGYGPDEVMGQNPRILGSGRTAPEVYVKMWATIVRGGTWVGELLNRRKDTSLYWETVAISPIMNDEGVIAHYVAVKADISYRKEAEAKIAESNRLLEEQALQLKRSNEELEQFAYVASHDLRQPLRMIASYLTLAEKELGDTIGEEVLSYLNFAIDGAKRMDVMIRDLLEYSRIGRKDDDFEALPLAEVMADCLLNLEVAIKEAKGTVTVAPDLPTVSGDHSELVRLFQNLIGNAVKYHAPDRPPVVEIAWSDQGADWLFTVKDNGIGIATRDYERAFGIFQRLVARDAYEGSGIGLSVCKKNRATSWR